MICNKQCICWMWRKSLRWRELFTAPSLNRAGQPLILKATHWIKMHGPWLSKFEQLQAVMQNNLREAVMSVVQIMSLYNSYKPREKCLLSTHHNHTCSSLKSCSNLLSSRHCRKRAEWLNQKSSKVLSVSSSWTSSLLKGTKHAVLLFLQLPS